MLRPLHTTVTEPATLNDDSTIDVPTGPGIGVDVDVDVDYLDSVTTSGTRHEP